jgi:hypothetical protein
MFSCRIISDGPHRPDKVYLVVDGALFASGQVSFGERVPVAIGREEARAREGVPPLQFVLEGRRRPAEG